jgi:hypothetical protein
MANENLGASFSIDTTDLKAGLAQANRMIRESESEFKAAAAGMDNWAESEDGLNAKIKSLNDITEVQRKKVNALQSEYDRLIAEGLDPTSRQATELRTKINNETAALNKNEAELKKQSKALEELADNTKNTADAADEAAGGFEKLKAAGGIAAGAVAAVGAACVGAIGAFLGLAESTRESRNEMAKLETAFQTAELSAENAESTFTELYGIMGDEGAAVEAAQQLAKISKDEADLAANTRILTGVMAEYGNSIPLEGLAEGIAASSAMSSVQGSLADALEWQGVNLDDYNAKLASLATEEERAAYIQNTLTDLYGASADAYRENNAEVIAAQEAQAGRQAQPDSRAGIGCSTIVLPSPLPLLKSLPAHQPLRLQQFANGMGKLFLADGLLPALPQVEDHAFRRTVRPQAYGGIPLITRPADHPAAQGAYLVGRCSKGDAVVTRYPARGLQRQHRSSRRRQAVRSPCQRTDQHRHHHQAHRQVHHVPLPAPAQ